MTSNAISTSRKEFKYSYMCAVRDAKHFISDLSYFSFKGANQALKIPRKELNNILSCDFNP